MRLLRPLWCCLFGAALLLPAHAATAPTKADGAPPSSAPLQKTVIQSDTAEMVSTEKESTFTFRGNVVVTGTNLKLTCDEIVVVARRSGDPTAVIGKQESFKSLVATGNVRIEQDDRVAKCGRAEIFPGDDKIVLSEPDPTRPVPRVEILGRNKQPEETIEGAIMELHRGQRRAVVLGDQRTRPTITLPAMKDLGYDKVPEKQKAAPATPGEVKVELPKVDPTR